MTDNPFEKNVEELQAIASQVRRDILRMVHAVNSGHPGGSLGCTEYFVSLYFRVLRHDPAFHMNGVGEDLFFLSNGHICPVWYSVLARSGYFNLSELAAFRRLNSRLQGHAATAEDLPGIRVASGSLGQGLSVAIGAAQAKKLNKDPHLVYVLMGDGELQEGQIWEATLYAAAKQVDNLIATVDRNHQQIDGTTESVLPLGDLHAKFGSFGWHVLEAEGNDVEKLLSAFKEAKAATGKKKPVMILMHTEMGYGVDFMTGSHKWHGVAPNDEQLGQALAQLPETLGDYPER